MSAIGTDRLCRPVHKHFRCWRLTGGAAPVPALLSLCRFLDAGNNEGRHAQLPGVQKAPRHEVAGSWAPAGQRLWEFDVSADVDGGCNAARKRSDVWTGEVGSLQWASRQALGAHQRARGALIAVIGSREITAGIEPARRNGKVATLTVGLSHDVS